MVRVVKQESRSKAGQKASIENSPVLASLATAAKLPQTRRLSRRLKQIQWPVILCLGFALLSASVTIEKAAVEGEALPPLIAAWQPWARPVALSFMGIGLIIAAVGGFFPRLGYLQRSALLVWSLNTYFVGKTYFLSGEVRFAVEALAVILMQVTFTCMCVGRMEAASLRSIDRSKPTIFESSVALFGALFVLLNLSIYFTNSAAVSSFFGRFFGVTANPQHTMMACALALPMCIYMARNSSACWWIRLVAAATIFGLVPIVYLTGSRTGFGAIILVFVLMFRDMFTSRRIIALLVLVPIISLFFFDRISETVGTLVDSQYFDGREDTRSHVFGREWSEYQEEWLFGVGLDPESNRLRFSEVYWLSALSNGGLLVAVPLSAFFISLVLLILRLLFRSMTNPKDLRASMYVSAVSVCLFISFLESIFAGIIAVHTTLAIAYVNLASLYLRTGSK